MVDILVDAKSAFKVGQTPVSKIVVSPINFVGYAECFHERLKESARGGDEVMAEKAFRRARRNRQLTMFDKNGAIVTFDETALSLMPRKLFVKVNSALDFDDTTRGKIISENGDGITIPIVYKLGTAFDFHDTKAGEKPIGTEQKIIELEFVAKTGGDIEEVLCHSNSLDQTIALVKTCAVPLGGETSLMRLPSWMINSLTTADGFAIMSSVLPVFIE